MRNVVLTTALALAAAAPAQAQLRWQDRGYANINLVVQPVSHDADFNGTFPLYDEPASFEGPREISGGVLFDIAAGARVWRNLAIGLGLSRFSDSSAVDLTATIPDPLIPNSPARHQLTAGGLDHSETGVHVSAVWFWPFTDKIDIAAFAGPSFFSVSHETVSAIAVQDNTSQATGVTTIDASETGVGVNLGIDVTYLVTPRFGAGLLLRYAGASVDVPGLGDSLSVGGVHLGVGLRVRF